MLYPTKVGGDPGLLVQILIEGSYIVGRKYKIMCNNCNMYFYNLP